MRTLRVRLATPEGQLALIVLALFGAVAAALALCAFRGFFEGLVREEQPAATPQVAELGAKIAGGELRETHFDVLPEATRKSLYFYGLNEARGRPLSAQLMRLDPKYYANCVRRTLVAGTRAQRERALEFAASSNSRELAEVLNWTAARAERTRDHAWAASCRRARSRIE